MFTFLWAFSMFAFRWRGPCSISCFTTWVVLFYFTQIYINGSFGAPDMYCDRVLARDTETVKVSTGTH